MADFDRHRTRSFLVINPRYHLIFRTWAYFKKKRFAMCFAAYLPQQFFVMGGIPQG